MRRQHNRCGPGKRLTKLNPRNALTFWFVVARTGLTIRRASALFRISRWTGARYFVTMTEYQRRILRLVFPRLPPERIKAIIPQRFKQFASEQGVETHIGHILDGFEKQMECPSDDEVRAACWSSYKHLYTVKWLLDIGLDPTLMEREVHEDHKLAHYARACTDVVFKFPFGTQELMGLAARGCYDLTQHAEKSGKSMEYYDDERKEKYVPHVIEPSIGVDRLMLAVLCSAYAEDEVGGEPRSLLKFHPRLAPIKCAVLPLVKNKPLLVERAQEIYEKLQRRYHVTYDAAGAIGRRYRRMDEVGTPFCVTVDFDTIEGDGTVTLRERDSTEQRRVTVDELLATMEEAIDG